MSQLHPVNKSFCLHQLFESNYDKLLRLIPQLHSINSPRMVAELEHKPTLTLSVREKTRFTLLLQLSYQCQDGTDTLPASVVPAMLIRVYLDSKAAEVIAHASNLLSLPAIDYPKAVLNAKWPNNYLLDKWLTHCLSQGYLLTETSTTQAMPA